MLHLAVCIPTRNRHDALLEAVVSCLRVQEEISRSSMLMRMSIVIRDNSDQPKSEAFIRSQVESILPSLSSIGSIHYSINDSIQYMSDNWELCINDALQIGADYICVLADRRLLSTQVLSAIIFSHKNQCDVLVCDHQKWWLSSENIVSTRQYPSITNSFYTVNRRFLSIYNCEFDNLTPRFYNCIVSRSTLLKLRFTFNSFVGKPFPDISFQFRLAFLTNISVMLSILPIIVTNARHAFKSVSATGVDNVTSLDKFNLPSYRGFFNISSSIITSANLSHLYELVGESSSSMMVNPVALINMIAWELKCPQTLHIFKIRQQNVLDCLSDSQHPVFLRMPNTLKSQAINMVSSLINTPAECQREPLQHESNPLSSKSFDRLSFIELHGPPGIGPR